MIGSTAAAGSAALAGADVAPTAFQPTLEAVLLTGETPLHLDASGARPIRSEHDDAEDRERREKIFARHLTPYLARATPHSPTSTSDRASSRRACPRGVLTGRSFRVAGAAARHAPAQAGTAADRSGRSSSRASRR